MHNQNSKKRPLCNKYATTEPSPQICANSSSSRNILKSSWTMWGVVAHFYCSLDIDINKKKLFLCWLLSYLRLRLVLIYQNSTGETSWLKNLLNSSKIPLPSASMSKFRSGRSSRSWSFLNSSNWKHTERNRHRKNVFL